MSPCPHIPCLPLCRSSTARKRLAVPYRAAHVPSERSEYTQPDTALLLTVISYYGDGLSEDELMEALQARCTARQSTEQCGTAHGLAQHGRAQHDAAQRSTAQRSAWALHSQPKRFTPRPSLYSVIMAGGLLPN